MKGETKNPENAVENTISNDKNLLCQLQEKHC